MGVHGVEQPAFNLGKDKNVMISEKLYLENMMSGRILTQKVVKVTNVFPKRLSKKSAKLSNTKIMLEEIQILLMTLL